MKRRLGIGLLVAVIAAGVWFIAGWSDAGRACAHDPRFACSPRPDTHPIAITDPQKSWAFYGRLGSGQTDTYTVSTAKAVTVPWQLLIERTDEGNAARPRALVRNQQGREIATLDLRSDATQTFFEPFSRIDYLATIAKPLTLTSGTYTITVGMEPSGTPQRYVMAIGQDERFGLGEIPYVFGAIRRVQTRGY
ncbi:MAG: hypothetical protein ACYDA1_04810 [Vulcanimicrobiaceae bacterium]